MVAVQVEVGWRAIDFEHRAGRRGRLVDCLVVHVVAGPAADELILRVRDDRHERMVNRRQTPFRETSSIIAVGLVERREDDVERFHECVVAVDPAVAAGCPLRCRGGSSSADTRSRRARSHPPAAEAVLVERAKRRGVLRVIGDRDVFVPDRAAFGDHVSQRVTTVAVGAVEVQVATNVGPLRRGGEADRPARRGALAASRGAPVAGSSTPRGRTGRARSRTVCGPPRA